MILILTGPLTADLIDRVMRISGATRRVDQDATCVRLMEVGDDSTIREQIATLCNAARVDHAFFEKRLRLEDFSILAMDMDSTLINIECIDEMADFAGKKAEVAAITEAAMRGEIADFTESLRRRVALLAGTPASILERILEDRLRLNPGAEQLIATVHAAGLKTLLVSGGFTYFARAMQDRLGLDRVVANELEIVDGHLTGRTLGPVIDGAAKAQALADFVSDNHTTPARVIAMGDGANDIPMLRLAGLSVAYRGKAVVREAAALSITFGTLETLSLLINN